MDGGMDKDVPFLNQVGLKDIVSNMILNIMKSITTSLLGGLPRDTDVLTYQFEFSGQGRLLFLLTRRLVRIRIGSQQVTGLDYPSRQIS